MAEISLLAWSKKFDVAYSQAQKMVVQKTVDVRKSNGRVLIDEYQQPPVEARIACLICGARIRQISSTHLRQHDHTVESYKTAFPNAPIVSASVSSAISNAITGTVRTIENRKAISAGRKGVIPQDHPAFFRKGVRQPEHIIAKAAAARVGLKHSDEAKIKIGDAHRGRVLPRDQVERSKIGQREAYLANGSPLKGRTLPEWHVAILRKAAALREADYTPERRAEIGRKRGDAIRGLKRTAEHKLRYKAAVLKRMEENPDSFLFLKDTKLEKDFEQWCIDNNIEYKKQCFISFNGDKHPYDFFLPAFKMLVECDGPLHWMEPYYTPRSDLSKTEILAAQQVKDAFWTNAAVELGFLVVRLRGVTKVGDEGSGSIKAQMEQWLTEAQDEVI